MRIFRKTHAVDSQNKGPLVKLDTNAPDDWPDVYVDSKFVDAQNINSRFLILAVAAALEDGFRAQGTTMAVSRFLGRRLHRDGILEIPIVLTCRAMQYRVFVYPVSDPDVSAEFSGVEQVCAELGEAPPIFYSFGRLERVTPSNPLRPFGADVLSEAKTKIASGQYAMWWSKHADVEFKKAPAIRDIRRAYQALDGIESYVFASMLRSLGLLDGDDERSGVRVALPEQLASFEVEGPEEIVMVVSASAEKGIRFHFSVSDTMTEYRDRFWKLFADYVETWRSGIEEKKWPKDPARDSRPIRWWTATEDLFVRQEEEGSTIQSVGILLYS